jgi:hypothetical protein
MKTGGRKRYRGVGKTNTERLDQALVEVPSKDEQRKLNLIKGLFKLWLPFQLRRRPLFEPSSYHDTPLFMWVILGRLQRPR